MIFLALFVFSENFSIFLFPCCLSDFLTFSREIKVFFFNELSSGVASNEFPFFFWRGLVRREMGKKGMVLS